MKKCNTMRLFSLLTIFILFGCNSHTEISAGTNPEPKDFVVKGKVNGILSEKVRLISFYGHKTTVVDSAEVDKNGSFMFSIPQELPRGVYRIGMGRNLRAQFLGGGEQFVDFIFKYEDIEFETHFDFPFDSMKVISSVENRKYYEYVLKSDEVRTKLEILQQSIQLYPRSDNFYKVLAKQYKKVFDDNKKYVDRLIKSNKGSLLSKIADFDRIVYIDPLLRKEERNEFLKNNFFGKNDFSDTLLLYTELIPAKVIRYLSLYRNENFPQEVQETEFIKAVNVIMAQAGKNEDIYNSVLDYLIEGFEHFGLETVLLHLYDSYVLGNSCFDEDRTASLKEKSEAIRRMGKGQPAPDFSFIDSKGKQIELQNIQAEFTLVMFWASWCGHCINIMPDLKNLYDNTERTKLEIIAISLDEDKQEWMEYITKNDFRWINHASLKKWDCPIARSYYIFATPSLILLDKDKNIVAKPVNARDVRSYL